MISTRANKTPGTESNRAQVCLLDLNVHYKKDTTLTSRNGLYHILFGQTTLTGSFPIPGRTFEEGFEENRWSLRGDIIIWKEDREFFEPAMYIRQYWGRVRLTLRASKLEVTVMD